MLEFIPDVETQLLARAQAEGTTANEYIAHLLEKAREPQDAAFPIVNGGKRTSAFGKYGFVQGGSEEFAQQKQIEIDLEDRPRL